MGAENWWITNDGLWGRAIWRGEQPEWLASVGNFARESGPPWASEAFGQRWLIRQLWPDDIALPVGERMQVRPPARLSALHTGVADLTWPA